MATKRLSSKDALAMRCCLFSSQTVSKAFKIMFRPMRVTHIAVEGEYDVEENGRVLFILPRFVRVQVSLPLSLLENELESRVKQS